MLRQEDFEEEIPDCEVEFYARAAGKIRKRARKKRLMEEAELEREALEIVQPE